MDVNLYAYGVNSEFIKGNIRNDNMGALLSQLMGLSDVQEQVTKELANFNTVGHSDGWKGGKDDTSRPRRTYKRDPH